MLPGLSPGTGLGGGRAGTCLGVLSSGEVCPVFATTYPPVLTSSCLCLPKFSRPWEVVAVLWP